MKKRNSFTGASNKPSRLQMSARFTTIRMSTKWHVYGVAGTNSSLECTKSCLRALNKNEAKSTATTEFPQKNSSGLLYHVCSKKRRNKIYVTTLSLCSQYIPYRVSSSLFRELCVTRRCCMYTGCQMINSWFDRLCSHGFKWRLETCFYWPGALFPKHFSCIRGQAARNRTSLGIRSPANAMTPGKEEGALQGCRQDVSQKSCDVQNKVALNS